MLIFYQERDQNMAIIKVYSATVHRVFIDILVIFKHKSLGLSTYKKLFSMRDKKLLSYSLNQFICPMTFKTGAILIVINRTNGLCSGIRDMQPIITSLFPITLHE